MRNISLLVLIFVQSVELSAEPKQSFEERMHNIYQSSYSKEVSDAQWFNHVQSIGNRTYTVQPGDTLWGLSLVFFGDGFVWSKLWSYNDSLTNPHLLSVGQNIHFFTGSIEKAPEVSVGESDIEVDVPDGFQAVASQQKISKVKKLYPGAPNLPAPRVYVKPVLGDIPESFGNAETYDVSQYDEKGISFDLRPPVKVNPLFVGSFFLYGKSMEDYPKVGKLVESEDNTSVVGLNQKVYIKSEESLSVGERFTVMGRKYSFDRNGVRGDVVQYQGVVEITEVLKDQYFRGVIIKSQSEIRGYPWITREPIPSFADDYAGRSNSEKTLVIGGGHDNVTKVFGQSDIVFLDAGANKDIQIGDIFGIYKRRDNRYQDVKVKRSPTPIGHIKVFYVDEKVASAFVIHSDDVIMPGDETGQPTIVEKASFIKEVSESLEELDEPVEVTAEAGDVIEDDNLNEELELESESTVDPLEVDGTEANEELEILESSETEAI